VFTVNKFPSLTNFVALVHRKLLNSYITSRPPFVCQNHRNISCTLVLGGRRHEQIFLVQKLALLAFEQGSLTGKNCQFFAVCIHEQVKLVKGKLARKYCWCTRLYSSSLFFSQNLISFVLFSASCIILQRFAIVAVSIITKERMQNYGLVYWYLDYSRADLLRGNRGHLVCLAAPREV
jgi:hypothetical protein